MERHGRDDDDAIGMEQITIKGCIFGEYFFFLVLYAKVTAKIR